MRSKRWCFIASWLGVFGLLAFLCSITTTPTASAGDAAQVKLDTASSAAITMPVIAQSWMMWQPNQYALAEDSQSLWIGTAGGIVRWDKANHTYQRYTLLDGLPHHAVYAIAVDAAGNRWFGGDHGISRLDANNGWTHFNVTNSDLASNLVDGIAVGADDTLWLSHGLPAGSISRRDPDGSWHWFPSRVAAVGVDYLRIRETRNANKLWTVVGNEIWVGYYAYNGSIWVNRQPDAKGEPAVGPVADNTGHVWATEGFILSSWNGSSWSMLSAYNAIGGHIVAMAAGPGDAFWVGGALDPCYGPCGLRQDVPFWVNVKNISSVHSLGWAGSVAALLPVTNSLWAVGTGWLWLPDGTIYDFADEPTHNNVTDILAGGDDLLWVHSQARDDDAGASGAIQLLDDRGTTALTDDTWTQQPLPSAGVVYPSYGMFEPTPKGDLWVAENLSRLAARWYGGIGHGGAWIENPLPPLVDAGSEIVDIFAQDENHTWFAFAEIFSGQDTRPQGIVALDDRGTPTDVSDDVWTEYPFVTPDGPGGAVAVDTFGRPWFANSKGIYRYDGAHWQLVNDYSYPGICDLVPANNGTLFAVQGNLGDCTQLSQIVLRIETDGSVSQDRVDVLVENNLDLVRSAAHRNRLWTVAPDGAVWYTVATYRGYKLTQELQRRDDSGLRIYTLPFVREEIRHLEVDGNNHVWIVANQALWRMSATPDFSLHPAIWLLAPGDHRRQQFQVVSLGGYQAPVTVTLSGLPSGVTAVLEPIVVQAGDSVTVTVSVDPGAPLGDYTATLMGVSSTISHTTPLTLSVVAQVHEDYLPFVAHQK